MRRLPPWILICVVLAPYFVGLGRPDLWDANETLYAEPPREALETGEWLVPTMNYEPWFVKPPGVTWITLPFYAVLGVSEFAGRLPMALAAALTILLTWRIGCMLGNRRAGLIAAFVLATTSKFFFFSRQLAGDVFLVTCFTTAAWGYVTWITAENSRRRGRRGIWIAGAVLGVGVLIKGPVAIVLPVAALCAYRLLSGQRPRLRPTGPALLGLAIALPWFVYMTFRFGHGFIDIYFVEHHWHRAMTGEFGGGRGLGFYPIAFFGNGMPWSIALPAVIGAMSRDGRRGAWRRDARLLPLCWCAVVLALFTLSTGKRAVYLLPVYPAFAVLLGITADRLVESAHGWRLARWITLPMLVCTVLGTGATVLLYVLEPVFRPVGIGVAILLMILVVLLVRSLVRRDLMITVRAATATIWCLGLWAALHMADLDPYRPARTFAERVARDAGPGDLSGRFDIGMQSLTFYGHRPFFSLRDPARLVEICRSAPHTFVVLPESDLASLRGHGFEIEVLERGSYLRLSLPALRGLKPLHWPIVLVRVSRGTVPAMAAGAE